MSLNFAYYLPLKKRACHIPFELSWIPFTKNVLYQMSLKLANTFRGWFLEVINFAIISPWKKAWSSNLVNLNYNQPRMICAEFGWIGPVVLDTTIFKFCLCIFTVLQLYSLGEQRGLLPTNAVFQIWLKLAHLFCSKIRIF